MFVFAALCLAGEADVDLDLLALFVRPEKNPLEVYPFSKVPLCIAGPLDSPQPRPGHKCRKKLMKLTQKHSGTWCETSLDEKTRAILTDLLANRYELGFDSGAKVSVSRLGPDNASVYTHLSFTYVGQLLTDVRPSNPVSVSSKSLSFTYDVNFMNQEPEPQANLSIAKFCFGSYALFIAFLVVLLKPDLGTKPNVIVLATVPSYNFLVVVLSGAGVGAYFFVFSLIMMYFLRIDATSSWWMALGIPGTISSMATGSITSLICSLLRLKDVASALYFAPLLFPSVVLAVLFSVEWIPICMGSCLSVPIKGIFVFLVVAVFVKLPVNLIAGLFVGSVCKAAPYHSLRSVSARRLGPSRRIFLAVANFLLFSVSYPLVQHLLRQYPLGLDRSDWTILMLYLPLWILASTCVGLASLAMSDALDWAVIAFLSSAGCGLMTWLVTMVKSIVFDGMKGTLQLSIQAAILALVGTGLSLTSGSIGVVAATLWIIGTGKPMKSS